MPKNTPVKNTTINLRVNAETKERAGKILAEMGLTFSEAFNLMLHQVDIRNALPFEISACPIPSIKLREAMEETEQILKEYANGMRKPKPFTNAHDMIQEILAEEDEDDVYC